MDLRRLSTEEVLAAGVISKPPPITPIPPNLEEVNAKFEWEYIGAEDVAAAVEQGKVVVSKNYYGIPHVWKGSGGKIAGSRYNIIEVDVPKPTTNYRVVLLQYRKMTEDSAFVTLDDAIEFFEELCRRTT